MAIPIGPQRSFFAERFWVDYFMQTRAEIDAEKSERDRILNYVVAVYGAIAFALIQQPESSNSALASRGVWILGPASLLLTSLFYIRRKKLQQIADRWFVLSELLRKGLPRHKTQRLLETAVVKDLKCGRYERKDLVLNYAFCLPIYVLLLDQSWLGWAWIILHAAMSYAVLFWRYKAWVRERLEWFKNEERMM